jgi:hypothetical protein
MNMSAFMVADSTINGIIAFLVSIESGHDHNTWVTEPLRKIGYIGDLGETLGDAMFALNIKSIEERYGEGEAKDFRDLDYKFNRIPAPIGIQAAKSLACFLYQSCEGEADKDPLFIALAEVEFKLAKYIVYHHPGWDAAKWG